MNYKTYLEVKHAFLDEGGTVNFVAEKLQIPNIIARCLTKDWGEQEEKIERLQQELMVCKEDVGMLMREKKEV
jgi:hypothetical protein